jgi:hypothetical protein
MIFYVSNVWKLFTAWVVLISLGVREKIFKALEVVTYIVDKDRRSFDFVINGKVI